VGGGNAAGDPETGDKVLSAWYAKILFHTVWSIRMSISADW